MLLLLHLINDMNNTLARVRADDDENVATLDILSRVELQQHKE
jgi:hypothetical protein